VLDIVAVTHPTDAPPWAVYAALITAGLGLLGQAAIRVRDTRDRRRDEYSRAFAAAMRWTEFPYRIARRLSDDAAACSPIITAFHETQEKICFHENWLRSVSDDIAGRAQILSGPSNSRAVRTSSRHGNVRRPTSLTG
jgi:hypothetical protein